MPRKTKETNEETAVEETKPTAINKQDLRVELGSASLPLSPVSSIDGWPGAWLLRDAAGRLVHSEGTILNFNSLKAAAAYIKELP